MAKNTIKCNITGTERVTNKPYLQSKADKIGISVEDYRANYVCKAALGNLKADIAETSITDVAMKLNTTEAQVESYINYNGKNKYRPAVVLTTEDTVDEADAEFVPTELTTV